MTRPTCRRQRPARSPTSRPRCSPTTSPATSAGDELEPRYDGHANCFIETGFKKALLIDFNYEVEPLPGHFPTAFGLPLLRESRLNHLGKLAFQWVYWHALLPGRELPGIGPTMPTAGKKTASIHAN